MAAVSTPLLVLQQSVLSQECRADGRSGRTRAHQVVLRLPRPRGSFYWPDGSRHTGQVLLRPVGSAAGLDLYVLPFDRGDQGPARQWLLRHRGVEAIPLRLHEEQDARRRQPLADSDGAFTPPQDLLEAVSPHARVLLDVPQGRADSSLDHL